MTKQVTEFTFQRKSDTHEVKMYEGKDSYVARAKLLRAARAQRAIVCAGPSSMKSLMLELVDVLQRLETAVSNCDEARPLALAAPTTTIVSSEPPPEGRLEVYDARRAEHRPLVDDEHQSTAMAAASAANEGPSSPNVVERYREREMRGGAADVVKNLIVNKKEPEPELRDLTTNLEKEAEALRDIICTFGERRGVALIDEVVCRASSGSIPRLSTRPAAYSALRVDLLLANISPRGGAHRRANCVLLTDRQTDETDGATTTMRSTGSSTRSNPSSTSRSATRSRPSSRPSGGSCRSLSLRYARVTNR